uniref:NADH dehydrogenase subunit 6 n=1 Tax=Proasellus assaforensis TaxID=1282049 RepID=A0A485M952_9CRUS|nr:NADH dehydrogenase subunit 6 [Proasellus assaforensis]
MLILLTTLGSLFLASNTPHMLISSLLASTLLIVITLGLMASFPWLAYILFLIFLGGILILFTYISSLSTNHLFSELKLKISFAFITSALMITSLNNSPNDMYGWTAITHDIDMFMKELFAPIFYPLYLFLFIYLLITLMYVVMVMKVYYAPLRSSLL